MILPPANGGPVNKRMARTFRWSPTNPGVLVVQADPLGCRDRAEPPISRSMGRRNRFGLGAPNTSAVTRAGSHNDSATLRRSWAARQRSWRRPLSPASGPGQSQRHHHRRQQQAGARHRTRSARKITTDHHGAVSYTKITDVIVSARAWTYLPAGGRAG